MNHGQTQCYACKAAYKQHRAVGATAAGGSIEAARNAILTAARTAAAGIAPFDNGQQAMTLSATSALCRVPQHPHHAPSAETTAAAAAAATTITHAASAASTIVTNTDQCVPQVARVIQTRLKFENTSNVCLATSARVGELLHGRPVGLVDAARALEGGDERVGELGGDLAPGGERGLALVEGHLLLLLEQERHDRRHLAHRGELHASGHVHEVQSGRESSREPLGYLPPSHGTGTEEKA